jgi:hypothetical protein
MTDTKDSAALAAFGGCVAILLGIVGLLVAASLINGVVVMLLWRWYVVPFGLPALSLAWAIGVGLVALALSPMPTQKTTCRLAKQQSTADKLAEVLGVIILRPGTLLLVGFVVHRFFMR